MQHDPRFLFALVLGGLAFALLLAVLAPWIASLGRVEWKTRPRTLRWQEAVLVLLAAGLAAALGWHYGPSARLALSCFYAALLLAIAYIDVDYRLVPNVLTFPGIVLALGGSFLWPHLGLGSALAGAVAGLVMVGAMELLGRGRLGTGDTKLAVLIGAMRGFPSAVDALFLGILFGGVGALLALAVLRRGRREYMPYAPYLVAGALLTFFWLGP